MSLGNTECTYFNMWNVPNGETACVAINEIPQVARADLEFVKRRAIEKA